METRLDFSLLKYFICCSSTRSDYCMQVLVHAVYSTLLATVYSTLLATWMQSIALYTSNMGVQRDWLNKGYLLSTFLPTLIALLQNRMQDYYFLLGGVFLSGRWSAMYDVKFWMTHACSDYIYSYIFSMAHTDLYLKAAIEVTF